MKKTCLKKNKILLLAIFMIVMIFLLVEIQLSTANQLKNSFGSKSLWITDHGIQGRYATTQLLGDVNGDSKADSIIYYNGEWWVSLSDGNRFLGMKQLTKGHGIGSSRQFLADVNGDGKADSIVFFSSTGDWWVELSDGNGFLEMRQWATGHGVGSENQFLADVNGDSKDDAIIYYNGEWWVSLSETNKFGAMSKWIAGHGVGSDNQLMADVNRDGSDDAIVFFESSGEWWVATANPNGGFNGYTKWLKGFGVKGIYPTKQFLADVNGDGMADAIVYYNGEWWVSLSDENKFLGMKQWAKGHGIGSTNQLMADVNGDGSYDALTFFSDSGSWYVALAYYKTDSEDSVIFQTNYVRLEYNPSSPSYKSLKVDTNGNSNYGDELLRDNGLYMEYQYSSSQWIHDYDDSDGSSYRVEDYTDYKKIVISGIDIGQDLTETHTIYLYKNKPSVKFDFSIHSNFEKYYKVFGKLQADLLPEYPKRSIYFAGRKGFVPDDGYSQDYELLTDNGKGVAGKIRKDNKDSSFVMYKSGIATPYNALNPFIKKQGQDMVRLGMSIWGSFDDIAIFTTSSNKDYSYSVTVDFGELAFSALPNELGDLKKTYSKFMDWEQNYIYWLTVVGSVRDYSVNSKDYLLNRASTIVNSTFAQWVKDAYHLSWIRDSFYGWHSAVYVAGDEMLKVMEDTIQVFNSLENPNMYGLTATNIEPHYSDLDSVAQLIMMQYDYYSKTGKFADGITLSDMKDRANFIIDFTEKFNTFGNDMVFIPDYGGYQTYPDISHEKPQGSGNWVSSVTGEQVYLNALSYDALRNVVELCKLESDPDCVKYLDYADRIQTQLNQKNTADLKSGLWNQDTGCYIRAKEDSGKNTLNPDSFGVFWAIETGLTGKKSRINSCLDYINISSEYYAGPSPTLQSKIFRQYNPWIAGIDIVARLKNNNQDAISVWNQFMYHYTQTYYPFYEAFGELETPDNTNYNNDVNRARVWDSWSFLYSIYAGHYGIKMTPMHVSINPRPLTDLDGDYIKNLNWQDYNYNVYFEGQGEKIEKFIVNGKDWYSTVLPKQNSEVKIKMSNIYNNPLLLETSDLIEVVSANYDSYSKNLELTVKGKSGNWEELIVKYPQSLGYPKVSGNALIRHLTQHYDKESEELRILILFESDQYDITITPRGIDIDVGKLVIDDMEDYPQYDWKPEQNIYKINWAKSIANGGGIYQGNYVLEAESQSAANSIKQIKQVFLDPLDLLEYEKIQIYFNSYGGAPNAKRYYTKLEVKSNSDYKDTSFVEIRPDQWNLISLDISNWNGKRSIDEINIYSYADSQNLWFSRFQVDYLTAITSKPLTTKQLTSEKEEIEIAISTPTKEEKKEAGVTPDNMFYWLDRALEKIRMAFTFGKEKKITYALKIAEERLIEIKVMIAKNKTKEIDIVREEYDKIMSEIEKLKESLKNREMEKEK